MSETKPVNIKQQIVETLKSAQKILITAHENPDGDSLGSALALQHVLDRLGKQATVAMTGKMDQRFSYLNGFSSILQDISAEQEFVIVLDEQGGKAKNVEVRRIDDGHIALVLTPESGHISAENISFQKGEYPYDCVVVLDCPRLELVGKLYQDNKNLFESVDLLAIDHHLSPSGFGKYNLSDTNAAATAEIMVSIIESLAQNGEVTNLIDTHVATALLTGLMTDTGSFQNSNTKSKSLTVAAQMLASGADHVRIVKDVFKTHSAAQLRLWGKALSHIKEDKPLRFAWATLTKADFVSAQAREEDSGGLIDELLKTTAETDFVLLLSERQAGLHGSLRSIKAGINVRDLASLFGGGGHAQAAAFIVEGGTLAEHEQRVIGVLRDKQRSVNIT